MSISLLPDISAKKKRKWLGVLLWSSFLFSGLLCDDAPGPPPPVTAAGDQDQALTSTATKTSTITITTTIAYKPSLIPGNSDYTLLGCYSQPTGTGKGGGSIFVSSEQDAGVPADNLTISGCLEGCASASEKGNDGKGNDKDKDKYSIPYIYAGLRNGR